MNARFTSGETTNNMSYGNASHPTHLTCQEDKTEVSSDPPQCNSPPFTCCGCPCGVFAAELEGVKLELVIMQKSIDSTLASENEKHSRNYSSEVFKC